MTVDDVADDEVNEAAAAASATKHKVDSVTQPAGSRRSNALLRHTS